MPAYLGLSNKMRIFVDAYQGNAKEAAEKAGYKNAAVIGHQNLKKPAILQAIREREDKIQARIDISGRKYLIATRKERQEFWSDTMKNPDISLLLRLKASELLGKSEADFTDRLLITKPLLIIKDLTGD